MRHLRSLAGVVSVGVAGACLLAMPALAECPELVGQLPYYGPANAVAVAGAYAYVADGDPGLRVVDVSDPAAPVEVGFYDTPGEAWGVAVSGGYVHLADCSAGLAIFRECPIFSDGFESGDTSAWTATVP